MYACSYGKYDTVKYLISSLKASLNLEDKYKRTALTYAVRNGHLKIVSLLIKSGAYFNYPDSSLNFPLHYACAYGWRDIVKLLLKAGA
jgi:ankyrin repeat protein